MNLILQDVATNVDKQTALIDFSREILNSPFISAAFLM